MKIIQANGPGVAKILERHKQFRRRRVEERVRRILADVEMQGDAALIQYTRRFDKARLTPRQLRVAESEISAAFQNITSGFVADLKQVIHNVTAFYRSQVQKPCRIKDAEGILLKENIMPLDSVGIYIPAGTAPLVSTVYMTVVPARVAGVKRIVMTTPPDASGHIHPYILAVANLLKVNEIYKVGGAQAIGALAYGTKTIPRVDKICGPGNIYVTEAKRQVFGTVDIDMLAGPTELVVIANRTSHPDYVIADMEAQAEHLDGLSILITTSRQLMRQVKSRLKKGIIIFVKNLDEAADLANRIAPEHLQILTNNPRALAKKIRNAGAVFLGPYSPTALGDYGAGPSHVLPTLGTARFFSGLSVSHFVKTSHMIAYSKRALERLRGPLTSIARLEGLVKHAESIDVRFET